MEGIKPDKETEKPTKNFADKADKEGSARACGAMKAGK